MVMRPRTKISFLRNDAVLPDRDLGDVIEGRVIANPTIIADYHLPREGDTNSRSDQNVAADFGPKESQNETSPRIQHLWRRTYKQRVEKPPELNKRCGSSAGPHRHSKARQILKLEFQFGYFFWSCNRVLHRGSNITNHSHRALQMCNLV